MRWSKVQPITRWLRDGARLSKAEVAALRSRLEERFLAWFGDADLLLSPTTPTTAPRVGAFAGLPPEQGFAEAARLGAFTAPFNVTGQPAISVPLGVSSSGLPIGVQLAGRPFGDALVLAVARVLESYPPASGASR